MKTIKKKAPPKDLVDYLEATPTASFDDIKSKCGEALRIALDKEQGGLCAFCCDHLDLKSSTRIAHVTAQSVDPSLTTDYKNMVLSCDTEHDLCVSCDAKQGSTQLPVGPLTPNVESLFEYYPSGRMTGRNAHATNTIRILNLDSPDPKDQTHRLRIARKRTYAEALALRREFSTAKWQQHVQGTAATLAPFQPMLAFLFK